MADRGEYEGGVRYSRASKWASSVRCVSVIGVGDRRTGSRCARINFAAA